MKVPEYPSEGGVPELLAEFFFLHDPYASHTHEKVHM
jgi:hypothetical protein